MVSFSVRKIRKNIIKSNFVLFVLLFAISCSDSSNTEQKIDKQKTYNWSLVTTWPKNYPGLGTNSDLIVDRGDVREFCAGSVAKIFEEIGGKVIYFGKPYPPVYNLSAKINGKNVLWISLSAKIS